MLHHDEANASGAIFGSFTTNSVSVFISPWQLISLSISAEETNNHSEDTALPWQHLIHTNFPQQQEITLCAVVWFYELAK